jgi:hypothetical protein
MFGEFHCSLVVLNKASGKARMLSAGLLLVSVVGDE